MKYFLYTVLLASIIGLFPDSAMAATASILHVPVTIAQQQQFYVDIVVDPQGKAFNAIQGSVVFSDENLSFVRAENGSSDITFFIDPPTAKGNTIAFSGIITGGFNGLVNPFDPVHLGPAEVVRLVFVGKAAGEGQIITTGMTVADNDGQGTLETVPDQRSFLSISTSVNPSLYVLQDTKPPLLTASIIQDKDLNNGKPTVVFVATDKQSGVDHVELKEGNSAWHTVQSPYVLQDQSRKSILLIRAVDGSGNATLITIDAAPHPTDIVVPIIVVLLFLCIVFYVIKKKYIHHIAE